MTTRIAIIARSQDQVTAAFYYDVPTKRVTKPSFVSAFAALPASDVSACQSGALIEQVKTISYSGWFDAVGHTWDGTTSA